MFRSVVKLRRRAAKGAAPDVTALCILDHVRKKYYDGEPFASLSSVKRALKILRFSFCKPTKGIKYNFTIFFFYLVSKHSLKSESKIEISCQRTGSIRQPHAHYISITSSNAERTVFIIFICLIWWIDFEVDRREGQGAQEVLPRMGFEVEEKLKK